MHDLAVCAVVLLIGSTTMAKEESIKPNVERKAAPKSAAEADLELLQIEKNIVTYTNEQRKRHGLPPLKIDPALVKSARQHASWMTRNRTLQHTRQSVAENIAMGQRTSRDAVRDWMNSSGHRANILDSGNRRIGAAAYRTEQGTIFWCQQFRR